MIHVLAECASNCSVWKDYVDTVTDPGHILTEVTYQVLLDGLLVGLGWKYLKRRFRREHDVLDAEHGITHALGGDGHSDGAAPDAEDRPASLTLDRS